MARARRRSSRTSSGTAPTPEAFPSPDDRDVFVRLSSTLTGFTPVVLEGTGQVESYGAHLVAVIGTDLFRDLLEASKRMLDRPDDEARDHDLRVYLRADPVLGPLLERLTVLWYTGEWEALPGPWYALADRAPSPADKVHVVSAESYRSGLAWRVAGAHPPGAKPTGHGGWSEPPVIRDEDIPYPEPGGRGR